MKINNLNETVILIDTEYLNEKISESLYFYQNLYPSKKFQPINLENLLCSFANYASVDEIGKNVDILFAFTLSYPNITNCQPNSLFEFTDNPPNVSMNTDKGNFILRSFFADDEETCVEHFINMLNIVYFNKNVKSIIMIADNSDLNFELAQMYEAGVTSLLMFHNSHNTEIYIPINYGNIDLPIARSLGLKGSEI